MILLVKPSIQNWQIGSKLLVLTVPLLAAAGVLAPHIATARRLAGAKARSYGT